MTALIVIPARWGSTRLPGKPLIRLRGITLIERAVRIARYAASGRADTEVIVATDDDRIAAAAAALDLPVVVSDEPFANGSERVSAAASRHPRTPSAVVNLQGDAVFTTPEMVGAILDALAAGAAVATPVVALDWAGLDALRAQKTRSPFSGTTCVRHPDGRAIWFSKTILPAIRDEATLRATTTWSPVFRHVGLYGYQRHALQRFVEAAASPYEQLEGLEQLRLIELGIPVETVSVEPPRLSMSGIDTPDDLARAERLIDELGEPEWW